MKLISAPENGMMFSSTDLKALLLPVIAEQLLSYLIGMMDSVMVASAGEAAVSAVSLVDSISVLFINIFISLAAGGAAVIGQYLGKKDTETARHTSEQLTVLMAVISTVCALLLILLQTPVLNILFGHAEPVIQENCGIYYHIVMFSIPFIALYNAGSSLFRATGDSSTPMKISLLMNCINIVGNAFLIYGCGMGVAGVAIPTLISRGIAAIGILLLALRKDFILNLRQLPQYKPNSHLIRNILYIGVPNGIESGMFQFGKLILMSLISSLTIAEVTANAIGNTIGSLHCCVGMAANTAQMAVISKCAGAGDYHQARWYIRYFLKFDYLWQGLSNVVLTLLIPFTLWVYKAEGDTAYYTTGILLIHSIGTIFLWPVAFSLTTGMRAAGDSQYAMLISTISMWLCRVAGAYIMIRTFHTGVFGVWIAWIIDWVFRTVFFVPRYRSSLWETKRIQ